MKDEEAIKFYELIEHISKLCRERGELSLTEVESMALAKDIRPSAVLDELSMTEGFSIDYSKGKAICR